jgi:hypothetical protein
VESTIKRESFDSSSIIYNDVSAQIIHEVDAMVKFAMSKGFKVTPAILLTLEQISNAESPTPQQLKSIVNHHNSLSKLIKPALPKNVVYLAEREKVYAKRQHSWQSKFPMLRKLLVFAFCATIALILTSLSSTVSPDQLAKGILHSSGLVLLNNFMFLSSAAAIGASFLVLSNVKSKFSDGTYHPDQDSSFWITILLGIIGGIIMSEIITIDVDPSKVTEGYVNNKMLYALLGGFSSRLVYNVLNKLIVAVESLITGGAEAKASSDLDKAKNDSDIQLSQVQLNLTGQLSALQSKINQKGDPEEIKKDISDTINSIFEGLGVVDAPVDPATETPAPPPTIVPEPSTPPTSVPTPEASTPTEAEPPSTPPLSDPPSDPPLDDNAVG